MRKLMALTAGALTVLAISAAAAGKTIKVGDNFFVRPAGVPTVNVTKGQTLTFHFIGHFVHRVVVKSGPSRFTSPTLMEGTYTSPKLKKGTYVIYCSIHGQDDQSMRLKVR
jgi:plastocyanin